MTKYFEEYITDVKDYLSQMIVTDSEKGVINNEEGLLQWTAKLKEIKDEKKGLSLIHISEPTRHQ